jgi:hypothetical protein
MYRTMNKRESLWGGLPDCIRKDHQKSSHDLPRTTEHYAKRHKTVKINALLDDVELFNTGTEDEKKQASQNWEEFFPLLDAMGLDPEPKKKKAKKTGDIQTTGKQIGLQYENRQVERLVWLTKTKQRDHFRGLIRLEDNTTKDVLLKSKWCAENFHPVFIELVKLSGKWYAGKKKWVPIPAGKSIPSDARFDIVEHVRNMLCIYQQGSNRTCLVHCFCSALHYVGMVDGACKLERHKDEYEMLPSDSQIRKLVGYVLTNIPKAFVRKVESALNTKLAGSIDIYSPEENSINAVVLKTSDGAADHAITTVKLKNQHPLVFDSNNNQAMKLNMITMDHCAGPNTDFVRIHLHICMILKPKILKTIKSKRKRTESSNGLTYFHNRSILFYLLFNWCTSHGKDMYHNQTMNPHLGNW